jgi:hypothetical protein
MSDEWPFRDLKNVVVFTVRQVAREGRPILRVSHDAEDGAWQFLELGTPSAQDAMILSLEEMVALDAKVKELADLPLGWRALRRSPDAPWQREPNP